MANLTEIDRIRIHDDMDQLTELLERKRVMWEHTTDPSKKDVLMAEMEQHQQDLDRCKSHLQR